MTVYLDCNATAPMEPKVRDLVMHYMEIEFGNAGSRTHEFGQRAKDAVQAARRQIANVVTCDIDEVVFTSGATEALNIAILGLREGLQRLNRTHIVTSSIEHKAVLEPIAELQRYGFTVTYVDPSPDGVVSAKAVADAALSVTGLVAVMQANNETGVIQPILELCERLGQHPAYLLVDAAQGFGKEIDPLRHKRIDLIAISGHKIYGPKGVGALVVRRRGYEKAPLRPIMFGGSQERGLRPGTLPVPLIAGLGAAAEIAVDDHARRLEEVRRIRQGALNAFSALPIRINGALDKMMPHVLNVGISGVDSEAVMVALKGTAAVSNGSACTSSDYKPSHVLTAMGQSPEEAQQAIRLSWSHLGAAPDWDAIAKCVARLC